MLDIRYVSSLMAEDEFSRWFDKADRVPSIAAQKFHRLFTEGLALDPRVNCVRAISTPPLTKSLTGRYLHKLHKSTKRGVELTTVPLINIPGVRQACSAALTAVYCLQRRPNTQPLIICDALCGAPSIGALIAARAIGAPVLGILTDVPHHRPPVGNRANRLKSILINRLSRSWLRSFDAYVVLTEAMNPLVNPHHKPYLVMEGLVDHDQPIDRGPAPAANASGAPRVVLYTGSTHRIYGLPELVAAFRKLSAPGWELHICGQGDMDPELRDVSDHEDNIKFFGVIPNRESVNMQRRASLLVNPRPTHHKFTEYSFPSKNMEYMASGTPVLTTALPGMPADYYPHVYVVRDETVAGFEKALSEVVTMPTGDLEAKGRSAQDFVLTNKNNRAQAARLVDMVLSWVGSALPSR